LLFCYSIILNSRKLEGKIFKRYTDENLGRLSQEVDRLSQAPVKEFMVKDKEWSAHALLSL